MRTMKYLLSGMAILCTTLFTVSGFANDELGNFGVMGGMTVPDLSGSTARPVYGFEGTAKLGSEYGLGAYFLNSTKSESIGGVNTEFDYALYGIQATYHFEGEAQGVYFGARIGLSKVKLATTSYSPSHYGLVAGFDKILFGDFSLGGEVSYISVASSTATVAAVTTTQDSFNMLNFLVAAKFWF